MDALFDFLTNNTLAFWIIFCIIVFIIISLIIVTSIAFAQGRPITVAKILTIGPKTPLENMEENIPRNFSEKYECNCELDDMLYFTEEKTWETVPDSNICNYDTSNCVLYLDNKTEKAHLEFNVVVKDNEQYTSQFKYIASGSYDGRIAHLTYRIKEVNGKKRDWKGVIIIRIPRSGRIYGFWMTSGIRPHPKIGFGSIQLTRKS